MKAYKEEEIKLANQGLDKTRPVKIDESLQRLSWLMDDLIRVPGIGWRFGLDAIVGLIPGLGDTATTLVSFYILASAVRYRVPKVTLLRMGLNIGIDYLVGSLTVGGRSLRRLVEIKSDERRTAEPAGYSFPERSTPGNAQRLVVCRSDNSGTGWVGGSRGGC